MVSKMKRAGENEEKKGRVKVGKLQVNKETVKDLSDAEKKKVKGGVIVRGVAPTKFIVGTCSFVRACT